MTFNIGDSVIYMPGNCTIILGRISGVRQETRGTPGSPEDSHLYVVSYQIRMVDGTLTDWVPAYAVTDELHSISWALDMFIKACEALGMK